MALLPERDCRSSLAGLSSELYLQGACQMNVPSALPQAVKGGGRSDGIGCSLGVAVSSWLDSAPAAVFLKSSAPGAYTTTRTGNDGECLLLWHRHLKRLAQSMEVLSLAMPDRFPPPLKSVGRLQDLVMPSLQMGLAMAGWAVEFMDV